jgi:hypothetical protein
MLTDKTVRSSSRSNSRIRERRLRDPARFEVRLPEAARENRSDQGREGRGMECSRIQVMRAEMCKMSDV